MNRPRVAAVAAAAAAPSYSAPRASMSDASASRLSDVLQRASISDGCCDSGGCSQCNASKTPLINAARQGRSDIVAALLAEGGDVNEPTTDGSGYTALIFACQLGFVGRGSAGAGLDVKMSARVTS